MTFDRLDTLIGIATIMLGLSMIITILNQMIASLLGHRAMYLKDGIVDILVTLDPSLKDQAEGLAKEVLTHKLSSDSIFAHLPNAPQRWKMATAIQPQELGKLLNLVSTGKDYEPRIKAILEQVNPAVQREARMLATVVPQAAATVDQLKQFADKATSALGHMEATFNSTMDRISQRFTAQMRIWTVIFSVIMALVFHLDAATLYSRLSTDATLRASVSGVSETMMKKYLDLQPSSNAGQGAQPATQSTSQPTTQPAAPASGQPAASAQPGGKPSEQELKEQTKQLANNLNQVKDALAAGDLQIFQVPEKWYCYNSPGEFFRILATAGLLSLGAPFWFNALKTLTSLRSATAQKESAKK
ncbi:MAG: PT domain-containing protein [Acidobacteriia bacterium]|nr:PT domain-containing protein [Terriglobia bacterium]